MKVGVRKPSIKRSIKARTTGKVKRKVKKTVNPLYGKKGMGYVRNPKKAVYNKVYHKTTVGVPTAVRAASGLSGKKNKSKKQTTRKTTTTNNNARANNAPQRQGSTYYYNFLIKDKPSIIPTIISGGVTILCILAIPAFLFMLLVTLGFFGYYYYKLKQKDYYTDEQLEEWAKVLRKYDGIPRSGNNYKSIRNGSVMELNKAYKRLIPYVNMREPFNQPEDYLYAITFSQEIIDFSPYVCIKSSNERLQPQFWIKYHEYYLNQYYTQEYNRYVEHAKTLKTENGKKNQINKYKEKVEVTVSAIDPNYEDKMNSIINEKDFC